MTLTKKQEALLARDDLAQSAWYFKAACMASRAWDRELTHALAIYGNHGAPVSGCGRNHFPVTTKEMLRKLARMVSERCDNARAAAPKRVRKATIRALGQAVATRDGCGFYGPQATG